MSALFGDFWTNRCSSPLRLRGGYWYILDVILKVHYLIDISLQETREEISQCRLRYFWECQDVFRHCSVASMLCFAAILFWRWFLTIIVASWRTMLKMFNDCCTMADNYCCTTIVAPLLYNNHWQLLLHNDVEDSWCLGVSAKWTWAGERWILQLGTNQSIQVNTLDLMMMTIPQKEKEEKHSSSQLVSRHF